MRIIKIESQWKKNKIKEKKERKEDKKWWGKWVGWEPTCWHKSNAILNVKHWKWKFLQKRNFGTWEFLNLDLSTYMLLKMELVKGFGFKRDYTLPFLKLFFFPLIIKKSIQWSFIIFLGFRWFIFWISKLWFKGHFQI